MTDESLAVTGLCPAGLRGYALGLQRAAALVGANYGGHLFSSSIPAALRHLSDEAALIEGFAARLDGTGAEAQAGPPLWWLLGTDRERDGRPDPVTLLREHGVEDWCWQVVCGDGHPEAVFLLLDGQGFRTFRTRSEAEFACALEAASPARSTRKAAPGPSPAEAVILQPGTVEEVCEEGGGTRFRAHGPRGWRMFDARAEADAWIAGQAPRQAKRKPPARTWTDEQRAAAAERMRAYNAKRGGKAAPQETVAPEPEDTPAAVSAEAGVLTEGDLAQARTMLARGQGARALSDWFGVHPLEWWQAWCERERQAKKAQP